MTIDRLPILSAGRQDPGSGKVCAEQAVNWLVSGRLDLGDETDAPSCVHPVLNALSIRVNDLLPDNRRGEMWPLILAQPGAVRPDMEPVLSIRLAAFCAMQVLDLTGTARRDAEKAIAAALAWCDEPSAAYVAHAANVAYVAHAADAAAHAANAAAHAANAANAAATPAAHVANAAAHVANAANAAANAANAAYVANAVNAVNAANAAAYAAAYADRLLGLLADCQAEHARLTGHTPTPVDSGRIVRLAELVGAR